ncbi:hypothetical protein BHM03_00045389 [Ensete ventricosum]|nr:hypothetical protein BHM03_00045389 [Ensete ventricosum]
MNCSWNRKEDGPLCLLFKSSALVNVTLRTQVLNKVFHTDLYRPIRAVHTSPSGYQYADRSLPGGTAKIDRRRSISTVGDRLEEIDRWRSIEGEKGKKKKKRKRRKKKEEEKKKEYLALFLPARCRRPRAAAALARGLLASRRDPRSRFFSRTRRKIEATRSQESSNGPSLYLITDFEDSPRKMLAFMLKHGHYNDACLLFFPQHSLPSLSQPSPHVSTAPSSSPQRADPLATDYGTIDDLCDLCIGYGCMVVLQDVISERIASAHLEDATVSQYLSAALTRICNYCETHRHFNYLYKFLVL